MIKVAFVAAIAMVCGINVFNAQKCETLSEIVLDNVEALADKTPSGDTVCRWDLHMRNAFLRVLSKPVLAVLIIGDTLKSLFGCVVVE